MILFVNIIKCESTTRLSFITISKLAEVICTTGKEGQLSINNKIYLNGSLAIAKIFGNNGNCVIN